jgi:streptogramin lyase
VRDPIELHGNASFSITVAVGFDAIWVGKQEGLIEVNPATDDQRFVVQFQPQDVRATTADVVTGGGAVWLAMGDGRLFRVDPRSGHKETRSGLGSLDTIAYGHGSLWTTDTIASTVTRYDPATLRPDATIDVPAGVDDLVSGDVAVWALSRAQGLLTAIDVGANATGRLVQVGAMPQGLAAGLGSIWVGDRDGVLRGVDEETGQVTAEIRVGAPIRGLAVDEDTETLWVDVV